MPEVTRKTVNLKKPEKHVTIQARPGRPGKKKNVDQREYIIYSIPDYKSANDAFIAKNKICYSDIDMITRDIEVDKGYHTRIIAGHQYIFFGDIDHYHHHVDRFKNILMRFLINYYGITFTDNDFFFTMNNSKPGSYHYSIPKWNLSTDKLREIHKNLIKKTKKEFVVQSDEKKRIVYCVDTVIYSNHWFRYPNQRKSKDNEHGVHIIQKGNMTNFIIDHIPKDSVNVNNIVFDMNGDKKFKTFLNNMSDNKKDSDTLSKSVPTCCDATSDVNSNDDSSDDSCATDNVANVSDLDNDDLCHTDNRVVKKSNKMVLRDHHENELSKYNEAKNDLTAILSQSNVYKKMFDECYEQKRFEVYEYWVNIGMAIKNTFVNENDAVELFNYYSSKGNNYEGPEKTKIKYQTFIKKNMSNGITVATIYYYAVEDNKSKFIEIMNKNTFELEQTDICKYIKLLAGNKYLYTQHGEHYRLYCFNGNYWKNDDILLKQFVSTDLYNFLKMILTEVYWNAATFNKSKAKIERLKMYHYKCDIVKTYKEYGVDLNVKFDNQWWLFGFNNLVYDLKEGQFRKYRYNDYVSLTTKYDWRNPTDEERNTMNKLIDTIMPIEEEKKLYLQILCTTLEGRSTERFILFNGSGGNGKGMINDMLLLALGQYAVLGNNSILFEKNKTGSNPEKACLHQKRCVIFREPCERDRFQNAIIKELTGGGNFSARSHYEKDTEKELHMTMIVECNKRPLFAEEPQDAELRRLIDVHFKSKFVTNKSEVDEAKHIYLANAMYKTKEFQEKHKFALLQILFDVHKMYKNNDYVFDIPKTIEIRSKQYLELSCNIVEWFKDSYVITDDPKDILKLKDLFDSFKASTYYDNLTKLEKRKYNKKYFVDHISDNIFFKKYYHIRCGDFRNVLKCCTLKPIDDDD